MIHQEEHLQQLLRKYADNLATDEEIREMLELLQTDKENAALWKILMELSAKAGTAPSSGQPDWENSWNSISGKRALSAAQEKPARSLKPVKRMNRWRFASAAAVLFLIAGSGYLWLNSREHSPMPRLQALTYREGLKHDAAPGKAGAVLTLADGSQIILDSAASGMLTQQGNARIENLNGALTYTKDTHPDSGILYNYLATRRGEQYPLTLSDGTKIWLNAASSIRYPTVFSGPDRTVEISGEAYAEIAPDAAKPFRVRLRDSTEIQVLGTRFNVNSYEDENTITTSLLDGAVKITALAQPVTARYGAKPGSHEMRLAPGQQAQVGAHGEIKLIDDPDMEEVIAWKNGYFQFTEADLPALMRQLSRWYDLDVEYQGTARHYEFSGKITRNINLSSLLKALKLSGVVFKIEGNKLIVIS